jgi:hypothetical protein
VDSLQFRQNLAKLQVGTGSFQRFKEVNFQLLSFSKSPIFYPLDWNAEMSGEWNWLPT